MSSSFGDNLKAGALTFAAFVLVLFLIGIILHFGFGLLVGTVFAQPNVSDVIDLIPNYFALAVEFSTKCAFCNLCILALALYFGLRAVFSKWFGWIEAGIIAVVIPAAIVLIVGRKLESGFSLFILSAAVPSVLFCRYLLLKSGILNRSVATP